MTRTKRPYSAAEFRKFKRLVEMAESTKQMDRITARFEQPKFIASVGREKCDLMFARLNKKANRT